MTGNSKQPSAERTKERCLKYLNLTSEEMTFLTAASDLFVQRRIPPKVGFRSLMKGPSMVQCSWCNSVNYKAGLGAERQA